MNPIERIKRLVRKYKILYWAALILAPSAAYLYGLTSAMRPQPPQISVDNARVKCNCPECISVECASAPGEKEGPATANVSENVAGKNSMVENSAKQNGAAAYVASKNGGKYYPIDCGYVSRIKEENRVYYANNEEAEADGKEPADVCTGNGE